MKCPKCDVFLVIAERQSIEIDYCLQCRGVWLDRGELDKIIERSTDFEAPRKKHKDNYAEHHDQNWTFGDRDHYQDDHRHKPHKKKSLLGELFDFD
jgi:uncharacterized protein